MSLSYNGTELQGITWNGADLQSITMDGVEVWSAIKPNLKDNTPAQIQYAAQHDLAASLWNIGDYFEMTLNGTWQCCDWNITLSNYVARCVLIGINHNASLEGNHLLHFQIGKNANGYDIGFDFSRADTITAYFRGWIWSPLRDTVINFYNTIIPSEWRAVIKACNKYTYNGEGTDGVSATSDNCFLLSEYEVFGARTYAYSIYEQNYQRQYAYYANGNSKVRLIHNSLRGDKWWLRSLNVHNGSNYAYCAVNEDGTAGVKPALNGCLITPSFCIG